MITEQNFITIRVSKKNYELLRHRGHTPESFDDIITKMLEEIDGENKED
jgi:hypothetical protein